MVAHELEGVAPLDERHALVDQAFELGRSDLGAVLLALRPALRVLVVVEVALDPFDLAVEEVDEGPEEVREIVPGLAERLPEDVEDVVERSLAGMCSGRGRGSGSSWCGRWPWSASSLSR